MRSSLTASRDDGDGQPDAIEQVKHTIQLPLRLWTALDRRARLWGVSKSEAIRRAVWVLVYLGDRMDEGSEIVVHRSDGKEERLVIAPY
jgi:hypothetical protein